MNEEARTTSLMEIREFLGNHQYDAAPWDNQKRVVDQLYDALNEKRDDLLFWTDLKSLVRRLEDRRFDQTIFSNSTAFQNATLDQLLDDLRRSLGDGDGGSSGGNNSDIKRWAKKSISATALFSFLLLGVAVGCNEDDGDDKDSALCAEAEDERLTGQEGEVFCDLVDIIRNADIPSVTKMELLECLPELDATYREEILEMFQSMTDQEIADYLTSDYMLCDDGDDDYSDDDDDDYYGDDDH